MNTVDKITTTELAYLPAVLAAVQAAETVNVSGETKYAAVLDTVTGVSGAVAQTSTDPRVQGIAALIDLTVLLMNRLGSFKHKPAATPQAS